MWTNRNMITHRTHQSGSDDLPNVGLGDIGGGGLRHTSIHAGGGAETSANHHSSTTSTIMIVPAHIEKGCTVVDDGVHLVSGSTGTHRSGGYGHLSAEQKHKVTDS
jgi:hypothetical protein